MSQTSDLFRSCLDWMIDHRKPLAVVATHIPWEELEVSVAHRFARRVRTGRKVEHIDLFGPTTAVVEVSHSSAGRPRLVVEVALRCPSSWNLDRCLSLSLQPEARKRWRLPACS